MFDLCHTDDARRKTSPAQAYLHCESPVGGTDVEAEGAYPRRKEVCLFTVAIKRINAKYFLFLYDSGRVSHHLH